MLAPLAFTLRVFEALTSALLAPDSSGKTSKLLASNPSKVEAPEISASIFSTFRGDLIFDAPLMSAVKDFTVLLSLSVEAPETQQ